MTEIARDEPVIDEAEERAGGDDEKVISDQHSVLDELRSEQSVPDSAGNFVRTGRNL